MLVSGWKPFSGHHQASWEAPCHSVSSPSHLHPLHWAHRVTQRPCQARFCMAFVSYKTNQYFFNRWRVFLLLWIF